MFSVEFEYKSEVVAMTLPKPSNDDLRTREAGREPKKRSWIWIGYLLVGVGIVFLGIGLTAAGYGYYGWTWIAVAGCAASVISGVAVIIFLHRRSKSGDARDAEFENRYLPRGFAGDGSDQ
ncbi:hypothetical protein [Antrihabitans stalactiti]|uniref:Transmembrane protein n=1 Tax=Antrihabitans stalactiti TaxID=2584121 RepID=A0A848K5G8_9NOCA|nr:hypothetical protein [Antrihabitans stalactiti]NMN93983.1 hypothetical protein [Antrihabitans stalactiti]